MSKTTETSADEQTVDETGPEPACDTNRTGTDTEWDTKDAAVYPPGYPRLCSDDACFGNAFEQYAEQDDGHLPGFDHTEDVDEFVRTTGSNNSTQRLHRPAGGED